MFNSAGVHRLSQPVRYLPIILSMLLISTLSACQGNRRPTSLTAPSLTSRPTLTPTPEIDSSLRDLLPISQRSFEMGTAGFIPRRYPNPGSDDWEVFLTRDAASYGGLFGIHILPDAEPNQEGIPEQIQLAYEQMSGVEPYIALGINPEQGPFTDEMGQTLKRVAVASAEKYQPRFLSLGVESNTLYLSQQGSFSLYVSYARDIYDAVKGVSPETQVMNNFQLERMKGATGLTGQEIDPHWHILDQFEGKMDLVSFTVYPFLHYREPAKIPPDYLGEIRKHTDLPIMITETGWPTQDIANGAEGSDQHQIEYMMTLFQQANEVDLQALIWVFPHDAPFEIAGGIFDTISLRDNAGKPKPGFQFWRAALSLPHR